MRKLKWSAQQYRNIKGFNFKHETSDPAEFDRLKKECKDLGFKYRIIDNQFYKQTL